jgi:hypothetical protein
MVTIRSVRSLAVVALACVGASERLAAQSSNDLAAFNALIVSPAGALPPSANDDGRPLPDRAALFVSYGRWRYDINDAIHHNLGVTARDRLGASNTSLAVTGAYLSSSCDCAGWWSGGVSLESVLWRSEPSSDSRLRASGHVAIDAMAGGARFSGVGHASAYSFAGALDIGGSVRLSSSSRLALSVFPGFGYGHLTSVDELGGGTRPVLGAAASLLFARGVSIDLGARRIVLVGGPTQLGAGVSWHRR